MNPNQKAIIQKKAYLKKLTTAARQAFIFETDNVKKLETINKALWYGEDHQWLVNSEGVSPKLRNSFNTLIRRNVFYREQAIEWREWREQDAKAAWDARRGVELNRRDLGLSHSLGVFH